MDREKLKAVIPEERLVFDSIAPEYLSDTLGRRKGKAEALVFPLSAEEVSGVLKFAHENRIPVTPRGAERTVLRLHPALAPFKAAVLPLSKKLSEKAMEVYAMLSDKFMVDFDETGAIGKRYRREDEIGTPFCITYDFDSETDNCVTVRDRDTMQQVRLPISELSAYIEEKIHF